MITIQKYHEKELKVWDDFIKNSINGTIFQTQKFINYHIIRNFKNSSLIIRFKNDIVAVLPGATIIDNNEKIFHSHPGSSYGGLVINQKIHFDLLNQIIIEIDKYCIKNNFNKIILINSPSIYYKYTDHSLDYLLHWNNYIEKELYISHAVCLKEQKNPKALLSKRKKRYIQNSAALNNITFHNTTELDELYALLLQSKLKYGAIPTHSLIELRKIQQDNPSKIKIIISQKNKKTIGGMVLFLANTEVCLVFYNIISEEYRKSQLSALQLYRCLEFAKKHNFNYVDFGVSHTPEQKNPLSPKFSLIQFKEQFAAKGVLRKVYQKKLCS